MRYIFCVGLKTCEVFETSQVFPRVCRTCHCERSVAIANYTLHADIAADKVRDCGILCQWDLQKTLRLLQRPI